MKEFTYSFIIPHKNCPDLLRHCVESIPEREDVQIIVVDDNSDDEKKPQLERQDVEVFYVDAEHSKGAGHARNVGLERVKGKWVLFADADDYYLPGFLDVLDEYKNKEIDILYFNAVFVNPTLTNKKRTLYDTIDDSNNEKNKIEWIKYVPKVPWNKMVSSLFIEKYGLQFEEIVKGNDMQFSFLSAFFSKNVIVENRSLYSYVYNRESLTNKKRSIETWLCSLCNYYKINKFYTFIGHSEWQYNYFTPIKLLINKGGIVMALKVLLFWLNNRNKNCYDIHRYVKMVKQLS